MWSHCNVMSKKAMGDTSASTSAPSPSVNAVSPWSQVARRPSAGDAVRRPRQYRYAAVAVPTIGTGSKLQSSSGDHSMLVVLRDEFDEGVHREGDDSDVRPLLRQRSSMG